MSIKLIIDESAVDETKERVVVKVSGNTVGECIDDTVRRQPALREAIFDENGAMYFDSLVRVNGELVSPGARDRPVRDGDEIEIIRFTCAP